MEEQKKNLELDKICRVCLGQKKEMRPIFGELVADMLMEFAKVKIENTDGWPDKICIQCVHSVSRCHTFKKLVEKSDQELREYITGLMVVVEDAPDPALVEMQTKRIKRTIKTKIKEEQQMNAPQIILGNGNEFADAQIISQSLSQIFQTSDGGTLQVIHPIDQNGDEIDTSQLIQLNVPSPNTTQFEIIEHETNSDHVILQPDIYSNDDQYFDDETGEILDHTEMAVFDTDEVSHFEEVDKDADDNIIACNENVIEILNESDDDNMIEEIILPDPSMTIEHKDEDNIFDKITEEENNSNDDDYIVAEFIKMQTSWSGPGQYECNLCHQVFRHMKWLQHHMKSHSNWIKANCKKQPECEICHKTFKGPGMLRMHMKTHQSAYKVPTCNICKKQFKSKAGLYGHKRSHLKKIYSCGHCTKKFPTLLTVTKHLLREHPDKEKKYKLISKDNNINSSIC